MLQVISVDSSIMQGCGLTLMPVVIRKGHGQMLIESVQHSYFGQVVSWVVSRFAFPDLLTNTYMLGPRVAYQNSQM